MYLNLSTGGMYDSILQKEIRYNGNEVLNWLN